MVYEPGGYAFIDYIKFGVPLQLVCFLFTVVIVFSMDYWWAYAVGLAFLSPVVVMSFFFFGGHKDSASSEGAEVTVPELKETDKIVAAIENGSSDQDLTQSVALLPINGNENTHANSDVIFKGSA
jgi:hypothetical protein